MSHLPPLAPRGVGTQMVESLTSYVRRLAAILRVSNRSLVGWLAPQANLNDWTEAMNGTERVGADIAAALAAATGLVAIESTTLAAVGGLHLRRDFAPSRQWCSRCLEETGYDALVTALRVVDSCPIHGTALTRRCPEGHLQRTWAAWARPLRCAVCGSSLLTKNQPNAAREVRSLAAASIIAWIQQGGLLEPRRVAAWLRGYRGTSLVSTCAEHFGWVPATISNIEGGAQRLQFSTVLTLVERGNVTIADIHQVEPVTVRPKAVISRRVLARVDVPRLRTRVQAELLKPANQRVGVGALARELEVNHITLRRHVPETTRLVDERVSTKVGSRTA